MMKRFFTLLLAVTLLFCTAALAESNALDLIENAMYMIVLRTEEGDIPLGSGVLFVENRVLLAPAACVQEGSLYAIGTDGEYPVSAADVLDDSGVAVMELVSASANTPMHMSSENAAGMACLFGVDAAGEFIVAPLIQLRNTVYHGQEALLLSSTEGLLPGAFIADEHGNLIVLTLAQHGEGNGTYLSLDVNALYRAMTRQQYEDAFLPAQADYTSGMLTITWKDEPRMEGVYLVTLSADDNDYYTFFEAPYTDSKLEISVAPGHRYDFQVQWVQDKSQALEPVWGAMSSLIVPMDSFTDYGYTQEATLITRTDDHAPLKALTETTLALMTDPGLKRYLQVTAAYDVEEPIEIPMTVELLAPDGQFYYESAVHTLTPKKETHDTFLLPMDALLSDCTTFSGGMLALGQYKLRYSLGGGVAGEVIFQVTENSAADLATEQAAADAEEARKDQPISGFITQLTGNYENGAVTISWPAEEIPEGATVEAFYLYDGNSYYTYHRMQPDEHTIQIFTVPGRDMMIWVYWTLDPAIEMTMPQYQMEYLIIPAEPETAFTLNGFKNQRLGLASSAYPAASSKTEFLPEVPLTREILTNQEVPLYFQTEDTYQVNDNSSGHPMMLVLCTPEGQVFAYPLEYLFDATLQGSDLWLFDISSLCRSYEAMVPNAWSAGDYRFLYCIDGQVAGEICFTLE